MFQSTAKEVILWPPLLDNDKIEGDKKKSGEVEGSCGIAHAWSFVSLAHPGGDSA